MAVLQWNIRGLRTNSVELSLLTQQLCPHVICLQETKLPDGNDYPRNGYTGYHQYFTENQIASGGTSIYVNRQIPSSRIPLNTSLQAVAARVSLHRPTTICSIYIPPDRKLEIKELEKLQDQLPAPFLILGDFNAHNPMWGSDSADDKGKIVENFLLRNRTYVLNDGTPTHVVDALTGKESCIDLSLCDPDLVPNLKWSVHDDRRNSDHYPIIITPDTPQTNTKPQRFNFKRANWDAFQIECSQSLNPSSTLDFDDFHTHLLHIAEKHIPKTSNKPRRRKVWFSEECQKSIHLRKQAFRKFLNTKSIEDFIAFKKARAQARRTIKDAKRNSFRKYVSKINPQTPMHKVWKIVKKLKGTHTDSIKHVRKPDGSMAETEQDIANCIASTLSQNSSSQNYNTEFTKHKETSEKTPLNFTSLNTENYNCPFTLHELVTAISDLSNTAPGPDNIHNEILKHLPNQTLLLLLDIYNHYWETHTFPDCWRHATIIPIPKPQKDHTNPSNYRPIALTSCLCKLMEKLVNKRLMWFLETTNSFSDIQCGFRKSRSTMDHLVSLETLIRDTFINKQHAVAIFFDLEKAFDTTWKYGILKDLHDLGLRGHMASFVENFLKDRSFKVRIGSTLSDTYLQEEGVPQGSILSPLLFEIKINSIAKELDNNNVHKSLYVDDFLLCYQSNGKIDAIERQLQDQLNKLKTWANKNGFKFSPHKTVGVHFCKRISCVREPDLYLDTGNKIPFKNEARFLGVIFDKHLTFLSHITDLRFRCQSALNALKVLSNPEWGGDTEHLLQLYRSLVRSKLDYACPVYGSACKSNLETLDPIQNQGLRLALGAFRTSPVESLQAEANEPSLHLRRKKLSLQYATKQSSLPKNPAHKKIFKTDPRTRKNIRTRQTFTKPFSLRISPDLRELNFSKKDTIDSTFPHIPPWKRHKPNIDLYLTRHSKEDTNQKTWHTAYTKLLTKYPNFQQIFTDGSKETENTPPTVGRYFYAKIGKV